MINFAVVINHLKHGESRFEPFEGHFGREEKTNKWLAEQLGKDQTTISKWCTNSSQPDLASLIQISKLLDVDIKELIRL